MKYVGSFEKHPMRSLPVVRSSKNFRNCAEVKKNSYPGWLQQKKLSRLGVIWKNCEEAYLSPSPCKTGLNEEPFVFQTYFDDKVLHTIKFNSVTFLPYCFAHCEKQICTPAIFRCGKPTKVKIPPSSKCTSFQFIQISFIFALQNPVFLWLQEISVRKIYLAYRLVISKGLFKYHMTIFFGDFEPPPALPPCGRYSDVFSLRPPPLSDASYDIPPSSNFSIIVFFSAQVQKISQLRRHKGARPPPFQE